MQIVQEFKKLWRNAKNPPDVIEFLKNSAATEDEAVMLIQVDQCYHWRAGRPRKVEEYLIQLPERLSHNLDIRYRLALGEFQTRASLGDQPKLAEYAIRFPDIFEKLRDRITSAFQNRADSPDSIASTIGTIKNQESATLRAQRGYSSPDDLADPSIFFNEQQLLTKRLGRYDLIRLIGEGSFGLVYLAVDNELERKVAIKVPKDKHFDTPQDTKEYLQEARTVASLSHPHIVPVYDVGTTVQGVIYVVTKYIDGETLSQRIKKGRMSYAQSADLLAKVALGLEHAHVNHLIHRDLKPSNILLEKNNSNPYIADFGLAVHEEDYSPRDQIAGTPAYMSPEQARGEGHRLDGRSDIFSLGIILYELLTGIKPFVGQTSEEVIDQVIATEPANPRSIDPLIPIELERICLRALAKRAGDRYQTAGKLAEDLMQWSKLPIQEKSHSLVVPKGLRSFDAEDASFFLELLPGPRNLDGLPDSIIFWKSRIEHSDPDKSFRVGLLYGPSGCGKSSLVKAGLLPRLSSNIIAIYLEATPEDTENRILKSLRKSVLTLPPDLGLVEAFSYLRRNHNRKVVIVLDQFEQWLQAYRSEQETDLLLACRQCDGKNLQVVLMIRDDFWMAATRLMSDAEVEIAQGVNVAAVDLFSPKHAMKVLTIFGRAFGDLQEQLTEDNKRFLEQAVHGLCQDGSVVSVQLAVFAEMMKGKPWTPDTLHRIGGTKGIGVNFLEESFCSRTANPKHKQHQDAARSVLGLLLPELGSEIKGHMRSYNDLLEISGYSSKPSEFEELIRVLDRDLRLITLTAPEGNSWTYPTDSTKSLYQLTHDFLVPSLREWLTGKQKESRKGRALIKLTELAALWNAKPEDRHLPSLAEYISIRFYTDKKTWTEPQRKMMSTARGVHGFQLLLVLCGILVFAAYAMSIRNAGLEQQRQVEAVQIVKGLLQADTSQVPSIIETLQAYKEYAWKDLQSAYEDSQDGSNGKLHAALAVLQKDITVLPYLKNQLLKVNESQFPFVRDLLLSHKELLVEDYWRIVTNQGIPKERFQAACALATYDPQSTNWQNKRVCRFLADYLTQVEPSELLPWRNALRPVQESLVAPLAEIYRDSQRDPESRSFATYTLADYLQSDPHGLFNLLADSNERQFEEMYNRIIQFRNAAIELGNAEIAKPFPKDAPEEIKEAHAVRQANCFIMLLRMNASQQIWPLLKHSSDPRARSFIIHWVSSRGGGPKAIIDRLEMESDVSIKRALLLCLGEFPLSLAEKNSLTPKINEIYLTDPDAGVHSCAEWLLRQWGDALVANHVNLQQANWFINSQGQTFVILPPTKLEIGSPESERNRNDNEQLHSRNVDRVIAISTKEVTLQQWRFFSKNTPELEWKSDQAQLKSLIPSDDSPMIGMTWYEAAWYCNWLSAQEGIPESHWCYVPNSSEQFAEGMKAKDKFWELQGYRLPTEVEWEYACRAGTTSSRYYGLSTALLHEYAWYQANGDNHSHPTASLKPNDFGIFDMYGNVYEWCYDPLHDYPGEECTVCADHPPTDSIIDSQRRILRGGSFFFPAMSIRSASRSSLQPGSRPILTYGGFRPVRTLR